MLQKYNSYGYEHYVYINEYILPFSIFSADLDYKIIIAMNDGKKTNIDINMLRHEQKTSLWLHSNGKLHIHSLTSLCSYVVSLCKWPAQRQIVLTLILKRECAVQTTV